jgi:hypothetical protein
MWRPSRRRSGTPGLNTRWPLRAARGIPGVDEMDERVTKSSRRNVCSPRVCPDHNSSTRTPQARSRNERFRPHHRALRAPRDRSRQAATGCASARPAHARKAVDRLSTPRHRPDRRGLCSVEVHALCISPRWSWRTHTHTLEISCYAEVSLVLALVHSSLAWPASSGLQRNAQDRHLQTWPGQQP